MRHRGVDTTWGTTRIEALSDVIARRIAVRGFRSWPADAPAAL
jgi:hypothetical protein